MRWSRRSATQGADPTDEALGTTDGLDRADGTDDAEERDLRADGPWDVSERPRDEDDDARFLDERPPHHDR